MVVLKCCEDSGGIVLQALEAAQSPQFQDLNIVCSDGEVSVSAFIMGSLSPFLANIIDGVDDLVDSVIIFPEHSVNDFKELFSSIQNKEAFRGNQKRNENLVKTLDIRTVFLKPKDGRYKNSPNNFVGPDIPPVQEFLQRIPELPDIESAELFDPVYLEDIEIENEDNLSLTIHSNESDLLVQPAKKKSKSSSKRKMSKKLNIVSHGDKKSKLKKHKKKVKMISEPCDTIAENEELMYSCSACGNRFKTETQLSFHAKSHIAAEQNQHICNFCGKYFKKMFQLQNHIRVHTGDKPYVCHTCGKAFNQETTLRTHMRIHSGFKPFKCEECGEAFNASNALTAHKLWKHSSGNRPFLCSFCSKSFPTKAAVKKHETIHKAEKKHACTLCEKKFARADHLKSHLRSHKDGCTIYV